MGNTDKIVDGLLVLQYRSGSKKALTVLVKRHHPKLCRHAYWYTQDLDAAKDIAQDCWGIIIRKVGGLRDPNRFGSWALRIVTRRSLDYVNKNSRERTSLKEFNGNKDTETPNGERELDLDKLRTALKGLAGAQQQVLHLFYMEEYSLKEIGAILEIPTGTVKSRLYHAREKLKTIIKEMKS
jgi:RNA polymerase sigma-70 factor (ECF subfamily)